ncbi:uncharacterized protein Dana_GF18541 [Drosophila ananassae]|uniref:Acylphosphatase n=1 Tax=Drosophila ananassae TaxID=7217 RepID=B3M373_DROAN|nr:acylphosphatase-2 [Drosophila ananassae]EDV43534.2 uncharacterized protein Dana_GF18541 [Drosophila ananassae]
MALRCDSILVVRIIVSLSLLGYLGANSSNSTKIYNQDVAMAGSGSAKQLFACNFEVFGRVQGVFFRKYTEQTAQKLGLKGWCMNTKEGTVKGQLEGPLPQLNEMKHWLQTKGSPKSVIEKAEFTPSQEIDSASFSRFEIRR